MSTTLRGGGSRGRRERLLEGSAPPDTALARLLAAARGPAGAEAFTGLDRALAAFVAAHTGDAAAPSVGAAPSSRRRVFASFAAAGLAT